jgi:hypothetical protein
MKDYVLMFRMDITTAKDQAGYLVILAKDMNEAVSIAENCPILAGEGTSVEIRETATPGQ